MIAAPAPGGGAREKLVRPILIVSTPRSGSTLLYETLAKAPGLFSTKRESHMRIEQVADFHPARRQWTSNRLDASDATPTAIDQLSENFYDGVSDRNGQRPSGPVRILEKTPKNALRVPFFAQAWPDSLFVYLYRDARQTLASMIEAWLSGRFVTYPRLPGWGSPPWSLLLVPGWRALIGRPLPEVVARQWAITTSLLVDDLSRLPPERVVAVDYDAFSNDPRAALAQLSRRLGLEWDVDLGPALPLSQYSHTPPSADKWRKHEAEIAAIWPLVEAPEAKSRAFYETLRL